MKATIDVPDGLYRRVKARSALEGRSVRDVAIALFERWVDEAPSVGDSLDEASRRRSADAWLERWGEIGRRIADKNASDTTIREQLTSDRR